MDYIQFKNLLKKSTIKLLLVSFLIIIVGLPFLVVALMPDGKALYWVFGLLFTLLGIFILLKSIRDLNAVNSGEHPLLQAITNRQKGFVVWMYTKEIQSKVEGVNVGKSNNIVVVTEKNKLIEILVPKNIHPTLVLEYLYAEFPDAYMGYTDEIKKAVKELFKK